MEKINQLYASWRDLMDNKSDPRTANYPLMGSPFPTVFMCLLYVYIVKVLGPKFMANRPAFKLKKLIILYNFLQVIASVAMFMGAGWYAWFGKYNWRCEPCSADTDEDTMMIVGGTWWYYISKITEFPDTYFFVLRKRFDLVTNLHVIHHGIMPFAVWWGVKFLPGGHGTFFGFLNTFVHIWMYLYYLIAAVGPEMKPYLWWKKYLTIMQMVQFVAVFIHAIQLFFYNPCNYPLWAIYPICGEAILFLALFSNYFMHAHLKPKNIKVKKDYNDNTSIKQD